MNENRVLRVGQEVNGYCGGIFGGYGNRRVEAIGADWVILRTEDDQISLWCGVPEELFDYMDPREQ